MTQDRSILNALSAHIALLDTQGVITATNRAWDRFALDNGGSPTALLSGSNYFAACSRAAEHGRSAANSLFTISHRYAPAPVPFLLLRRCYAGNIRNMDCSYPTTSFHWPTKPD